MNQATFESSKSYSDSINKAKNFGFTKIISRRKIRGKYIITARRIR